MLVYLLVNRINNKVYVGKTEKSLAQRLRQHKCLALTTNSQYYIHRAIRKYGFDNFEIEVLEDDISDPVYLNKREISWISYFESDNAKYGYNLTAGGEGQRANNETREKIRQANKKSMAKNRERCLAHIEKLRILNTGRKHTPEDIEKIRRAGIGRKHSPESREKMKGKHAGVRNGNSTLTEDQVRSIRSEYIPRKVTLKTLAIKYGVGEPAIYNIVKGKTYKSIQ